MGTRVFVGNVNPQTTRAELERLFANIGRVVSIYVPLDRDTRQHRGFAFVDLASRGEAERAIQELDGAMLGGRRLRLTWAVEKGPRPGNGRPERRPPAAPPAAADPDDWEWSLDGPQADPERAADAARRRRRGGKHGSDRKHRQGTRRFID